jgi:hypothetical protein
MRPGAHRIAANGKINYINIFQKKKIPAHRDGGYQKNYSAAHKLNLAAVLRLDKLLTSPEWSC